MLRSLGLVEAWRQALLARGGACEQDVVEELYAMCRGGGLTHLKGLSLCRFQALFSDNTLGKKALKRARAQCLAECLTRSKQLQPKSETSCEEMSADVAALLQTHVGEQCAREVVAHCLQQRTARNKLTEFNPAGARSALRHMSVRPRSTLFQSA